MAAFMDITISIRLNSEMDEAMPKGGSAEMKALDDHIDKIHEVVGGRVIDAAHDLRQAGYIVEVED